MKITLEAYDEKYTAESIHDGQTAQDLMETFSRLLVLAGFEPGVIQPADGGRYVCKYLMPGEEEKECQ